MKLDKNEVTIWLNSFVNVTKPYGELSLAKVNTFG